jgi:hypothetical protein
VDPNPIATPEQHEHEREALALTRHPRVRKAHARLAEEWLAAASPGPDMRAGFEDAFDEVMFSAAVWGLNRDPLRPRVVCITRLAHPLGDLAIPGSRWGIDNPDSVYRVIPISGRERYVIRGRVAERRLTENYFTLWDADMNTIDVLSGHDLVLDADRRFEISVDTEPANGRANHIRSSDAAVEFYIRDVLLDWARDVPNELSIERLGAPADGPGPDEDAKARVVVETMERFATLTRQFVAPMIANAANDFGLAWSADTAGALRNQFYIGGNYRLGGDDAMVIDLHDGGAAYFTVPTGNIWGTTFLLAERTSTLNKAQSVPNADGSYTFVLSPRDPGVHNWIDPCGTHEGLLTLRLAEFPGGRPEGAFGASSRVVPLAALRDALPPDTKWVTPEERARQRRERAKAYRRRLPELSTS